MKERFFRLMPCLLSRKIFLGLSFLIYLGGYNGYSQQTNIPQSQLAVQLTAAVQESPPRITLKWKDIPWGPPSYTKIYRKQKSDSSWGPFLDSLVYSPAITSYTDDQVEVGKAYEYRVTIGGGYTTCPLGTDNQTNSGGFIYAGINAPAIHNRGTLILLVEESIALTCALELITFMADIRGDGWQIIRHDLSASASDSELKDIVREDYNSNPGVTAVLLMGHLAVPYSGKIKPDAHPEHEGAWPADVFYADMDGVWTDSSVTIQSGTYSANHNIPGDGKWDQSIIPSPLELQVSRIDLSDMPAFPSSEITLMKNYLAKDHAYKMNSLNIRHRGVLNDALPPNCGEGYSANAYRNWAPLISPDSITVAGYYYIVPFMANASYQWAYGAGGGNFTFCNQVGTTDSLVKKPNNTIFSMYFGSYFGDWNVQNNFLRAPLCQNPPTLTNCWVSRPNWFFHHMALGENIGYSTRITQNNRKLSQDPFQDTTYSVFQNRSSLLVSVALMGDLTLRTDYIRPASDLTLASPDNEDVHLNWVASPEAGVLGYYVYHSQSEYGQYTLLQDTLIQQTSFLDIGPGDGLHFYMVRPVKLQSTPSGTYYNLGIGIADSIRIKSTVATDEPTMFPFNLSISPNPAKNFVTLHFTTQEVTPINLLLSDLSGRSVYLEHLEPVIGPNTKLIDMSHLQSGTYILQVRSGNKVEKRIIIRQE